MDVTTTKPAQRSTARPNRVRNVALLTVILAALGFVVFRGLGNATLFFYNVDEAVAQQSTLGQRRFRLQGTVAPNSIVTAERAATFTVGFNGVTTAVEHTGVLPQLFQPNIPVVLEGHWSGALFVSDRMLVKHSEVYKAANPDRVGEYKE